MKKTVIFVALALLAVIVGIIIKAFMVPELSIHYHANFGIIKEEKLVDFSDTKYMNLKPCTVNEADPLLEPKSENIHLHNNEGTVVHLHTDGVTWSELFTKLKYNLPSVSQMQLYFNQKKVGSDILKQVIKPDDTLMIHIGSDSKVASVNDNAELKSQYNQLGTKSKYYNSQKGTAENCGLVEKRTFRDRLKVAILKW